MVVLVAAVQEPSHLQVLAPEAVLMQDLKMVLQAILWQAFFQVQLTLLL